LSPAPGFQLPTRPAESSACHNQAVV